MHFLLQNLNNQRVDNHHKKNKNNKIRLNLKKMKKKNP